MTADKIKEKGMIIILIVIVIIAFQRMLFEEDQRHRISWGLVLVSIALNSGSTYLTWNALRMTNNDKLKDWMNQGGAKSLANIFGQINATVSSIILLALTAAIFTLFVDEARQLRGLALVILGCFVVSMWLSLGGKLGKIAWEKLYESDNTGNDAPVPPPLTFPLTWIRIGLGLAVPLIPVLLDLLKESGTK